MIFEEFDATKQAREYAGDEYGDYIQGQLILRMEQGIRTLEETRALNLGQLLVGNDGA